MAMISTPLRHQQRSSSKPSQFRRGKLALFLLLMLRSLPCYGYPKGDLDIINRANDDVQQPYYSLNDSRLRGRLKLNPMKDRSKQFNDMSSSRVDSNIMIQQQNLQSLVDEESRRRSVEANLSTIFITPSSTFQIIMSILLAILILLQLSVIVRFVCNRSKRVLEFTQPDAICIFVACSIVATVSCYFYVFVTSSFTCAIREPLLFTSISLMGATVAGRAWRMSTLVNNPLLTAGKNGRTRISKIEEVRQRLLQMISALSSCGCSIASSIRTDTNSGRVGGRLPRPSMSVQITSAQMIRAIVLISFPQLLWQIIVLSAPALRSSRNLVWDDLQMMTIEQYQCQSSVGLWPHCLSITLTLFPHFIAYTLNVRPKQELDLLPEVIDERKYLEQSFYIFARVIAVSGPVIGLTYANNPDTKIYSVICAVLALPLACCYYIAYLKLNMIKMNTPKPQLQRMPSTSVSTSGSKDTDAEGRVSTSVAVRMAEMYLRIGRAKETVQLVNETLAVFRKRNSGENLDNLKNESQREVALGFTKNDLKALEEEDLQIIIRLLKLKGKAHEKLEGIPGHSKSAKLNVGALKLFENCPVASKMKDVSFMFPIYNIVSVQVKGGVLLDQIEDDEFSLETELAVRFCREAQLQAYHYARSLANLAEIYGRLGLPDEAFKYFNIMEAVYMKQDHPKLLTNAYAVDRCAVSFATSAIWYMQKGQTDSALERCDYVIDQILPHYDKKDIIGLFHIFIQLIRVLKWNGEADKARDAYIEFMPDAANSHFSVRRFHKPMLLLLQICEGSSYKYDMSLMPQDIELVLSFDMVDMQDNFLTCYGWSMKSMAAELCMLLAQRLDAGVTHRDELINRGIMMAAIADKRTTTSNGTAKHILAHEANKTIHKKLLQMQLANTDDNVGVVEDCQDPNESACMVNHSQASARLVLNSNESTSVMSTPTLSFADKLKTNVSATKLLGRSGTEDIPTPLSHISVASRKELSSMNSFASTSRKLSSLHSFGTVKEDSSKHSLE